MTRRFKWNPDKNRLLKQTRGICFEEIVAALENGQLLEITPHHNPGYANQKIMFVALKGHVVAVPCVETNEYVFLKTAFFDRRAKARYIDHDS